MARNILALWRLDDGDGTDDLVRPRDSIGNVDDLDIDGVLLNRPVIVDAALGRGRRFLATSSRGYIAKDKISGTTLDQRDMSIQVVLQWDIAAQASYGPPGAVYTRGRGDALAEYVAGGIELRVVNLAANAGEIRWYWQDASGVNQFAIGGQFAPSSTDYMMLTATRRWISSTHVSLRYYLGDQLLTDCESFAGSIGGGTTGTTHVGCRFGSGAYGNFFDGVIDEIRVLDYELTAEEVAATWRRITIEQPRGYELIKELHDPGFPISADPSSRVQRETRQWGHGIGYASAQAENARANGLPDHAYGDVLERWEGITKPIPPKPGESVEIRRARVLGRFRQDGVAFGPMASALRDLLATAPVNLQVLAYTDDTVDDYGTLGLHTSRWQYDPSAAWTISSGSLQCALVSTSAVFNGATRTWYMARASIGGGFRGIHLLGKITLSSFASNCETGFFVGDFVRGDFLLVALKFASAGNVFVTTEYFSESVSSGEVARSAAIPWSTGWLHVYHQDVAGGAPKFTIAWSSVADVGPYTSVADIAAPSSLWGLDSIGKPAITWAGMFVRSLSGTPTATVLFDDVRMRTPYSERPMRWYVFRDPALGGDPDIGAAQKVLDAIQQAHTSGKITQSTALICDDPLGLCDVTPLA